MAPIPKPVPRVPNIDEEDGSDLAIHHFNCDTTDIEEAERLCQTLEDLSALKSSIEIYGLSQQLLAFADHNKILSTNVEGIPSLESFIKTPDKYTSEAAVEGIVKSIAETAVRWYNAVKAHLVKYQKYYLAALTAVSAIVIIAVGYQQYIKGKKLREEADAKNLKEHTDKVNALNAEINELYEKAMAAAKVFDDVDLLHIKSGHVKMPNPSPGNITDIMSAVVNNVTNAKSDIATLKAKLDEYIAEAATLGNSSDPKASDRRKSLVSLINFQRRMVTKAVIAAKANEAAAKAAANLYE